MSRRARSQEWSVMERTILHLIISEYNFSTFGAVQVFNTIIGGDQARRTRRARAITIEDFVAIKREHDDAEDDETSDWAPIVTDPTSEEDIAERASFSVAVEATANALDINNYIVTTAAEPPEQRQAQQQQPIAKHRAAAEDEHGTAKGEKKTAKGEKKTARGEKRTTRGEKVTAKGEVTTAKDENTGMQQAYRAMPYDPVKSISDFGRVDRPTVDTAQMLSTTPNQPYTTVTRREARRARIMSSFYAMGDRPAAYNWNTPEHPSMLSGTEGTPRLPAIMQQPVIYDPGNTSQRQINSLRVLAPKFTERPSPKRTAPPLVQQPSPKKPASQATQQPLLKRPAPQATQQPSPKKETTASSRESSDLTSRVGTQYDTPRTDRGTQSGGDYAVNSPPSGKQPAFVNGPHGWRAERRSPPPKRQRWTN